MKLGLAPQLPHVSKAAVAALLFAGAPALGGCVSMKVDEEAAVERGRAYTKDANFKIERITPDLIAQLAKQKSNEPGPDRDPNGGKIPAPYTIAPYDVLHVTVWDHPELTLPAGQYRSPEDSGQRVEADGTMFYPHVGVVPVAGKTVAEVRALLTERLARVVVNPQLDVRIAAFRGKRVHITGEVAQPTAMPLTDVPLRVQDAISFAKGFTVEALNPTGPISQLGADLTAVTLTRGGKTYRLDLLALYERGDVSQNWLLQDGDVIHVGDRSHNRVFVLGEVKTPQAKFMIKRRMTLAEALADAAGVDAANGNPGKIYVIRGDIRAPNIYRLDANSADALLLATQFQLHPRDVVFVSPYELTRWNRMLGQILPTVQFLFQGAVAADIARRAGE